MVQPWTPEFNPLQPFPRNVMVWIRLPGLSGFFYKRKILEEIGGLIRKVAKLDFQTDRGSRGKLSRMVVFIDLEKPLVTKILVDGKVQRVEFESLPTVCFAYGRFGHVQEACPAVGPKQVDGAIVSPSPVIIPEKEKSKEPSEPFFP
ncbi:hypothetical protein GOBAR_DD02518 [Gossypium barbadense]|nr:hypothetical protein GOBAR_DD02518 [Gossypium barbadense]